MELITIADQITRDLNDSTLTMPSIVSKLQYLGASKLSVLISTDFELSNGELFPELTTDQSAILYQLYIIDYYNSKISQNLGATAYDWSELSEGDSRIRRVSKNEIAKTYITQRKDAEVLLNDMVFFYKQNNSLPSSFYAVHNLLKFNRLDDNLIQYP